MRKVVLIDDVITDTKIIEQYTDMIWEIDENLQVIKCNRETFKNISFETHADICAKIIKKYCKDVRFVNIVVKEPFINGHIKKFIKALDFASQLDADVIHMSIGTNSYLHAFKIYKSIKRLASKVKIVAAKSNSNKRTFPADFKIVSGCRAGNNKEIEKTGENNYALLSTHLLRAKDNTLFYTDYCNSYAAAYYTALYCCENSE